MKCNCFSLIKSAAHSLSGLLIMLYVSLYLCYLGDERKGKSMCLGGGGRAPSRYLHGHVGLQGETWKKSTGKGTADPWSAADAGTLSLCTERGVFAPGSLEERLPAPNPFPAEASPLDGYTSLTVSNQRGT